MGLIYGEPRESLPVFLLGAYCRGRADSVALPAPFLTRETISNPSHRVTYFSQAPLADIHSAYVFRENHGFCRGILFRYRNGGSRAVGECRLHVDVGEPVAKPLRLCFQACTFVPSGKKRDGPSVAPWSFISRPTRHVSL